MKAKDSFLLSGEMVEVGSRKEGTYRCAYVGFLKSLVDDERAFVVLEDPEITVYVTKPQCRVNTIKKECESKDKLDSYRCRTSRMNEVLFNAINNPGKFRPVYGYIHPKKILSNPYVYGADIDYGVRLKYAYQKANGGRNPNKYNVGHLDIETDVTNEDQLDQSIILITFMNGDGNTFVAVHKAFFSRGIDISPSDTKEEIEARRAKIIEERVDQVNKMWEKTEREFRDKLTDEVKEIYDASSPIKIHLKVCETEEELIRWTFDRIHECKPDFCTIWNINYDIPYILDRCKYRGIDPTDLFCHPDVPKQWRKCEWHLDKGKEDSHITDLWSWMHSTDYTVWIDSMCLYGRLRKAKGRDSSYKLNFIGEKEIGAGKLEFGADEGHYEMQMRHQVEYAVYNVVDVLILRVMELKNKDVFNMVMLSGDSLMDEFHHQSVQLKNSFYVYLDGINMVPGSVGDTLDLPFDGYIDNRGGAVLDPDRSFTNIAVPSVEETDDVGRVSRFVCDIDVSLIIGDL